MLADDADRLRRQVAPENVSNRQSLDRLVDQARSLSEDLRRISHRLHPAIVTDLGLGLALRSLVDDFMDRTGLDAELLLVPHPPLPLSDDVDTALYRIVQEGLRNIAKHAGQTPVVVTLDWSAHEVVLFVSDLGLGFDSTHKPGLGLTGMRERAYLIGAAFSIVSSLGSGTTIQVRLPIFTQPRSAPPTDAPADYWETNPFSTA